MVYIHTEPGHPLEQRITDPVTHNPVDGEGMTMSKSSGSWEQLAGKWKQFSGEIKKKWGKLTDDELMQINGSRDILAGKLQEKYGIAKEAANKQIDEWAKELKL